ncbi:zinc-dependent alcohol dehydrogenase [Streptomyces malaysiensis]|uniref:2-deoxy-scyllo-inosamine dehydrogenase n=1 Tax=Streptomyces malaysiensis subsp. samsunensis TaxID=459658 RepID=A0A9X2LZ29_STRMQ|nr:alcohol dehydrogenase catalytic domain-containing protein [Streptomyces samsunensis]MCQ8832224.1 alcohol dehydrogenase catalytic domain-containing protein [Streptomyces samsunensis]
MTQSIEVVELRGDGDVHHVRRPEPETGAGDLLIAVRQVGLCATDREIRDGEMAYFRTGLARYPIVPGHEWVGEVMDTGAGAIGFEVGDRVVGECSIGCGHCAVCAAGRYHMCPNRMETGLISLDGALATRMIFPARAARKVPSSVPDDDACLIEPTAVGLNIVRACGIVEGESVLVVGAGTIGLLAAQVAVARGAKVVSVADVSPERLAAATRLGAHEVVDAAVVTAQRWNCVIEASGNPAGLAFALEHAVPGGTVACVSLYGTGALAVDMDLVVTRDLTVRGALGSPNCWDEAIDLVAAGTVRPGRLITTRLRPADIAKGLDLVGRPDQLKVVIEFGKDV